MEKKRNRRRILVIDPKLQFRYLLLPLLVTLTTSACLFALFLIQAQSLKSFASNNPPLQEEIGKVQVLVGAAVGAVLLGHVAFIVWLGLAASHKVAGPLHRLRQVMKVVARGDRSARLRLRRGDQLTEVAEVFNEMMDSLAGQPAQPPEGGRDPGDELAEGPGSDAL